MDVAMTAKEKMKKKKKRMRRIKRIKNICATLVFLSFALICFILIYYPFKSIDHDEQVLTRDLTGNGVFIQNLPSEIPETAWGNDLPNFIKRDLKWIDKHEDYTIEYVFGEENISISRNVDYLGDICYEYRVSDWSTLTDVSIYEEDGKLLVYGRDYLDHFVKYTVCESDFETEYLTLDYDHIPLSVGYSANDVSWRIGNYALLIKDNIFYFYQHGKLISKTIFHDEIEEVYKRYSMVKTTNNILYGIYVYQKNGVPQVTTRFIDEGAAVLYDWVDQRDLMMYDEEKDEVTYFLPIVLKDEEYYTYVPTDWEAYELYNMEQEEKTQFGNLDDANLERSIVKIEDTFFSANITFDRNYKWEAEFLFNMGTLSRPKYFKFTEYKIRGYDDYYTYKLTQEEIENLSGAAFTIDEFWDLVEEIRLAYEKYYEKRGD